MSISRTLGLVRLKKNRFDFLEIAMRRNTETSTKFLKTSELRSKTLNTCWMSGKIVLQQILEKPTGFYRKTEC